MATGRRMNMREGFIEVLYGRLGLPDGSLLIQLLDYCSAGLGLGRRFPGLLAAIRAIPCRLVLDRPAALRRGFVARHWNFAL